MSYDYDTVTIDDRIARAILFPRTKEAPRSIDFLKISKTIIPVWVINQALGVPEQVLTTDPAAGAEITQTVPANEVWELMGFFASIVTSAAVANRTPSLELVSQPASRSILRIPAGVVTTASLTRYYSWGINLTKDSSFGTDIANVTLPPNLFLPGNWVIQTTTAGIQAGDDYAAGNIYMRRYQV